MLTGFRVSNFKSWEDTRQIRLAPFTLFFGRNSSGKSSLLQAELLMKQTAESLDPRQVLNLGGEDAYIDLGTYQDLIRDHDTSLRLGLSYRWTPREPLILSQDSMNPLVAESVSFRTGVDQEASPSRLGEMVVYRMGYTFVEGAARRKAGLRRQADNRYELVTQGLQLTRRQGRSDGLPQPIRCYGFPDAVFNAYENANFLADLSLAFDELMSDISYVGPLRERPQRSYQWRGISPASVGPRGENTVAAILAARRRHDGRAFEANLGHWLKYMGVIDEFVVEEIASGTDLYELKVTVSGGTTRVDVTDVGFGVSQVLPVLVQVFYADPGKPVILEQPEIHLHPAAQAALGDVLLAAVKENGVQLLVETHSEHLLRRLQRRIAEQQIVHTDVALYFVETRGGASEIHELRVDPYGNITNWPQDFFGDEIGDLSAMTEAAMERRGRPS